jgi:ubiquinol-cytochrome c reductase cytochrome b subunit
MIRRGVRTAESRTGQAPLLAKALGYVFPEHWSFLFGEIALYAFIVLVGTGIYLTLFFQAGLTDVVYHGAYAPLHGRHMSEAYRSALELSFSFRAGLLMRQTHHWAANLFVAAIVVHMLRIFFTGAYRKPRELNYVIGLTMLMLAVLEGYMGYSLVDDLLSGMGLAIGWAVAMSLPVVGGPLATLLWGGAFPGADAFESRLFIMHVLVVPVALGLLIGAHLLFITLLHHTQFGGRGRTERNVVGNPLWPTYAFRSLGLFSAVTGVLFMLGGLVQINPIWLWGPYEPALATNGAQPDWYIGWLIGALRLMPNVEPHGAGLTLIPNPFFGGVLFPLIVFGVLFAWPWVERAITGDRAVHHLVQRPRDAPFRTAFGCAFFTFVALPFFAGSSDRLFVVFDIPYNQQVYVMRALTLLAPPVVFVVALRICRRLRASDAHPLRGWTGHVVRRTPEGGYEVLAEGEGGPRSEQGVARDPAPPG